MNALGEKYNLQNEELILSVLRNIDTLKSQKYLAKEYSRRNYFDYLDQTMQV